MRAMIGYPSNVGAVNTIRSPPGPATERMICSATPVAPAPTTT